MLLCVWFLAVILFFAITDSTTMAQFAPPLKCVTFNVLHGGVFSGLRGNAQDLDHRLEITVEELRALQPDVIGLQEASTGRQRGNVAERLATQLGFHYVYAPASFRLFASETLNNVIGWVMNLTEGPAIISRFPIVFSETYDLPRCGRFTDPRVLLCAELETPWGRVYACSTHISGDICQTESIIRFLRQRLNSLPLLLMGDFNATESSPAITALTKEAGFVDTFRTANPTAPGLTVWQWVYAPRPTAFRRVDYLFVLPGTDFPGKVLKSRLVLNVPRHFPDGHVLWPSDHYGILTEVEFFPLVQQKTRLPY
ncbi:MAG: endonuclease/exonuclease/phosphatase family protein [Deltaproteobacteria bacterium]|nr:endonuclease/exonuclease/phosphatase family protein [Deltaproteobacteria bacterium]